MRVDSHARLHSSLDFADQRVYLIVVLLLHESASIHEDRFEDGLEPTCGYLAVSEDFHRVRLHFRRQQPSRQQPYEV